MITKIYGAPGTGKTTWLINKLKEYQSQGVDLEDICYLSFTNNAIAEVISRLIGDIKKPKLKYFSTIHAFARRSLFQSIELIQNSDKEAVCKYLGLSFKNSKDADGYGMGNGDKFFQLEELARVSCTTQKTVWEKYAQFQDLSFSEFEKFCSVYKEYKQKKFLYDFTDLLNLFFINGSSKAFKVLIVDEAQDLSTLQWQCLDIVIKQAENIYIAGDDDQAIYLWNGADPKYFNEIPGAALVLDQSYRLPKVIHEYSQKLIITSKNRQEKVFKSTEKQGKLHYIQSLAEIDMRQGQWLLLARNTYNLKNYEDFVLDYGFLYTKNSYMPKYYRLILTAIQLWEIAKNETSKNLCESDRKCLIRFLPAYFKSYIVNATPIPKRLGLNWMNLFTNIEDTIKLYIYRLHKNNELTDSRINISTIHAAKGSECENVILLPDMSLATYNNYIYNRDDEVRVFYTGITRAKSNLFILYPKTGRFFPL